jgi:hypothetical protein
MMEVIFLAITLTAGILACSIQTTENQDKLEEYEDDSNDNYFG